MSNRRQFLGTLGKALGAGGLLLPWAGKGALALPTDLGKAAGLPVTAAAMPWTAERLKLRGLKEAMLQHRRETYSGRYAGKYDAACTAWRLLMADYGEGAEAIATRPNPTWRDCVELAEIAWHMAQKEFSMGNWEGEFTGRLSRIHDNGNPTQGWLLQVHVALVEAILMLGGGERFDPREGPPVS